MSAMSQTDGPGADPTAPGLTCCQTPFPTARPTARGVRTMSLNRHLTRGRDFARTAGDHAADMFAPLTLIGRGLRRHAEWARTRWQATPKDRRAPPC